MVSTTHAVEAAAAAYQEAYQRAVRGAPSNRQGITRTDAKKAYETAIHAALAAALPIVCHERVHGWTEDEARPCELPAVAFREDEWEGGGSPYPVCAKHATPDLVPLTVAILGGAQ